LEAALSTLKFARSHFVSQKPVSLLPALSIVFCRRFDMEHSTAMSRNRVHAMPALMIGKGGVCVIEK